MARLTAILVVACACALAGCRPAMAPEESSAAATQEPVKPYEMQPYEVAEAYTPAPGESLPHEGVFGWTATPRVDDIPAGPIHGVVGGITFEAGKVEVSSEGDDRYVLTAATTPDRSSGGSDAVFRLITCTLEFTAEAGTTKRREWKMAEYGVAADAVAFYAYDARPKQFVTYPHGPWAGALEITRWESGKPAAGRIAICYNDSAQSWMAGEFEVTSGDR